jgi:hypothetical protein
MTATAYPLTWPPTFPRSKAPERGQFKTTQSAALGNVQGSLQRFAKDSDKALSGLVISSNVTLGVQRPEDQGVAVWFTWDGMQVCIAVDRYASVESNLQAIHHIIEARRTELRHGTLALVRATFTGFLALPAPTGSHWSDVLGVSKRASTEEIDAAYKRKRSAAHPDKGGTAAAFDAVERAYREATA